MSPCPKCSRPKQSRFAKSLKPFKKSKAIFSNLLHKFVPKSIMVFVSRYLAEDICIQRRSSMTQWQNQTQIYHLLMENPKLRSTQRGINWSNFIHGSEEKMTARYYASLLWNWKLHSHARRYNKINEHIRKTLHLTVMHMEPKDLQVIQMVIHRYYSETFKRIGSLKTSESIKVYLQERIHNEVQSLSALVEVIHNWFLSMPILLELSKCAGWDYLMFREACLLNVDTLYSILLNLMYGNRRNGQEQMRITF